MFALPVLLQIKLLREMLKLNLLPRVCVSVGVRLCGISCLCEALTWGKSLSMWQALMYNSCCRRDRTTNVDQMFLWNNLFKLTASHKPAQDLSRPRSVANKLSCGQGAFQVTSVNKFFCTQHGITRCNKPYVMFIFTACISTGGLQREFCFMQSQKAVRHEEEESG